MSVGQQRMIFLPIGAPTTPSPTFVMSSPSNTHESKPLVPRSQDQALLSIMGHEINIHSIKALEKQIEEGKGDIIKLKRARNSLLNVSTRAPPEILGRIFAWSLVREAGHSLDSPSHFSGLQKGSYNFILVCHHWFEVATRTPELWSFWGNNLRDWKKRHHRSGTAPLDLVLDKFRHVPGQSPGSFDGSLQDAVKDRVTRDAIRQVHLMSDNRDVLNSIISSLTPDDEGGQNENIESIILRDEEFPLTRVVDVSEFFARSRLPKLRMLELSGNIRISSWDYLAPRTTLLTALSLDVSGYSFCISPTSSQLSSLLASNPSLQRLTLSGVTLPCDDDESAFQVPLRDLNTLSLNGEFHRIFGLLRRLILPEMLDSMNLDGYNCTVEDIPRILEPYMRNHFQLDSRFRDRLEVYCFTSRDSVSISLKVASAHIVGPAPGPPLVEFAVTLTRGIPLPPDPLELFTHVVAPIPKEHVVSLSFKATSLRHMESPRELLFMMPNIEKLCLNHVTVSEGFLQPNPDGPHANTKLLPSLRSLCLEDVMSGDNNWGHLTTYLVHQTSDDQIISLEMSHQVPRVHPEVADEIEGLVEEFIYDQEPEIDSEGTSCSYLTDEEDEE